jgi:hypothetical protein
LGTAVARRRVSAACAAAALNLQDTGGRMMDSLLARLKRYDEERAGFAGEHWYALAAGLWLLARGRGSTSLRGAGVVAGLALLARAASGRDGLVRLLPASHPRRRAADRQGRARPYERYLDIAAPWPYAKRVRVAAITQPLTRSAADAR